MSDYAERIGTLAAKAALAEVSAAVKPGLVDRFSAGAHEDMNYHTFLLSIDALKPHFICFAAIGEWYSAPSRNFFEILRSEGRQAETTMLNATDGINTHKGLIFIFALLLGTAASLHKTHGSVKAEEFSPFIRRLTEGLSARDHADITLESHGKELFRRYGVRGARGEAEAGYPAIFDVALPVLTPLLDAGVKPEKAYLETLLHLFCKVCDTNVLHRGGEDAAAFVRSTAADLLAKGGALSAGSEERLREADRAFTARGISPGGAADLLAASILVDAIVNGRDL